MNESPKQRFLSEERLQKQFLDVVDSESFQRATELSMMQLQAELSTTEVQSHDAFERVRGAQRFLEILKALPEPAKLPTPKPSYNLNHNLK